MQAFAAKKKEERTLEEKKKKPPVLHAHVLSMSEGPMQLKETQKIEKMAREQFEKSVKIELEALLGKKKRKKPKKKGERKR
ncbi:MAG: hypothetical protein N3G22_04480 [Candidatus Micrarchaeota archaeon]|nr:hypothetical protein [Candidatus Micrarchaeota archaeon]